MRYQRALLGFAIAALVFLGSSPVMTAERPPFFVASVIFKGGETRLDVPDNDATRVPLPAVFQGWGCYVDSTQRVGSAFTKKVTCGGPWGFVDTFVTCDAKHREGMAVLRRRQPIDGTKEDADAAERVTITAGCGYSKK